MCGIVGYLGKQQAQGILLECLGRLEYRGYDSAGIAVIAGGKLGTQRSAGKCARLRSLLEETPLPGQLGIAHTRWATHGKPTDLNSHPHTDCSATLAIVHNGIVENYHEIKRELESSGHHIRSETDSEVIAHLIEAHCGADGGLESAVAKALAELKGAYALAVISQHEPDKIIVARSGGPPLVIGYGEDGHFVASDITAILHHSQDFHILENQEMAVINGAGVRISRFNGEPVQRDRMQVHWQQNAADKSGFSHYMLKEIYEQPQAVLNTIRGQTLTGDGSVMFPQAEFTESEAFAHTQRVVLIACGSSWHAAMVGKFLIESISATPVDVEIASEYRYRHRLDLPNTLVIGISQSGETADTLGALQAAKQRGNPVLGICNVAGSSMCRETDGVIFTNCGPEIGVAATKTFTCQITALVLFAIALGLAKGKLSASASLKLLQSLMQLPILMECILAKENILAKLAPLFDYGSNALYLARGIMVPMALEGALKLKEISYIHAEGYPAGELKHGPIAMIERELPVVVIATEGILYEKVLAAIQEVRAREGNVIAIATEGDRKIKEFVEHVFYMPVASDLLMPVLMAVPLQLLAYFIAVRKGCDVDKPRNLAKSVTVE